MEETQDIVDLLRSCYVTAITMRSAADEIERLRSSLAIVESDIAREREFRLRREEQCMALSEEVESLKRRHAVEDADTHGGMTQLLHRLEQANAERDALRAEVESLRAEHASDTATIEMMGLANTARGDEVNRLRARVGELEAEVARLDRLRKAAGIMMLGNVDAEIGAICEVIEAENEAEAMAAPAFDALDRDDVEAAKKVLRQMEADDRLCGTLTRARLAAMLSLEVVTASAVSDEEALAAWRKWAVEMAGIAEDDAQALEDETLRTGAADRWKTKAQVWKDAHGHAAAAHKVAMAQRDFYRTRLHAEIEAHSIRASKEKT